MGNASFCRMVTTSSPFAGLEHLTGLGIDDLGKGKVAPDVDTLLL